MIEGKLDKIIMFMKRKARVHYSLKKSGRETQK